MSTLEDVQAQAQACLSDVGETASHITAVKSIVEEHIQRSASVGSETQINGGQGLAEELGEAMSLLAEAMKEIEGISLQAQLLES